MNPEISAKLTEALQKAGHPGLNGVVEQLRSAPVFDHSAFLLIAALVMVAAL